MQEYTVWAGNYPYRIRESGNGTPFIWLHGMFYSPETEDIFSVFDFGVIEKHFRMIRIELPAHGKSPLPESAEKLTWLSISRDIGEIAAKLGIDQFIIGGFSQGAGISLHTGMNNPRVSGLVLAMLPKIWHERPALRKTYQKLVIQLEANNDKRILERLFHHTLYVPEHLGWNVNKAREINQLMLRLEPEAYVMILKGAIQSDLPEIRAGYRMNFPVMVAGWNNDPNHPVSSYNVMLESLFPDVNLLVENTEGFKQATEKLIRLFLR